MEAVGVFSDLAMVSFDNDFFINATEIYTAAGKSQQSFDQFKKRTLVPRAQKLIDKGAIAKPQNVVSGSEVLLTIDDLIISRKGGKDLSEQGTWIHPKLRMVFTRWISEDFDIWCDRPIVSPYFVDLVLEVPEMIIYLGIVFLSGKRP
ncbi:MAG: KilA-N domain-containing protein [Prolixibacteraceae bacterium]|nr:KilA-N domain-containing protein [Prolixibacteraceae bacterium]